MRKTLVGPLIAVNGAFAVVAVLAAAGAGGADTTGQQLFNQCAACHSTDGTNGLGPTLKGIVGRESASVPGFAYSNPMKRAHLQWTPEELDAYIANPQGIVPGNAMPYAGMPDSGQRAALIAYLGTLK
jgi:cytochrome c